MRFAITGIDRSLGIFDALTEAGWEPVKLFTVPVDNTSAHNMQIVARATHHKVPVQLTRMNDDDLRALEAARCDVLVVASYDWRIGNWQNYLPYAINFHPSLLPEARGPYPLIRAILREEQRWGVSCHKISPEFDQGDILAQASFGLDRDESHESINLKVEMAARQLASRVARNFKTLWADAQAQGPGSYWPVVTEAERTLDFSQTSATLARQIRAFGLYECKAVVNGQTVFVRRALTWAEAHQYPVGSLVYVQHRTLVIAVQDGFIGLVEWSAIAPGAQGNIGR